MNDLSHDCPILHVDMDAFFASVAVRDRPEYLTLASQLHLVATR